MRGSEGLKEIHQLPTARQVKRPPKQLQPPLPVPLSASHFQLPVAVPLQPPYQMVQWLQRVPLPPPPRNLALPEHHQQRLKMFWQNELRHIHETGYVKNANQLPVTRIRKMVKSKKNVNMVSSEVPILFSKACELFIRDLTLRAWLHTEDNKCRTLRLSDISSGIKITDVYDFLIDIVPRNNIHAHNGKSVAMGGQKELVESNDNRDDGVPIACPRSEDCVTVAYPRLDHRATVAYPGVDHRVTVSYPGIDHRVTVAYPGLHHRVIVPYPRSDNCVTVAYPGSVDRVIVAYPSIGIAYVFDGASNSTGVPERAYQYGYQIPMVQNIGL